MDKARITALATATVVASGVLWGFYWLPVRRLDALALPGAWGTLAIVAAAALVLAPVAWARRRDMAAASPLALASIALGGASFALYSTGFVYGRVAIIILLFFLTPVWSTLIGWALGARVPGLRLVAIALGLAGLGLMLGADGDWPLPRGTGEWLALVSGLLWAVATTAMSRRPAVRPEAAAFVFALGATLCTLALAPFLEPLPPVPGISALLIAALSGALWWGAAMAGLMWATPRLEPARTGILLMSEVLVGAVSGALLAGEHLGTYEIAGGALVLAAGIVEVWPVRKRA